MIKRLKASFLLVSVLFISNTMLAQTVTPEAPKKEEDEFAKKKVETKLTEVIPTDSVPASELVLRAINWIKVESDLYKKTSGANTSGKAECTVSFPVKPKDLNPQFDYTGKITMKVVIECKSSKYKYTVSEIKHISKSGNTSGGSIDNKVPECGSMGLDDLVWKKLKGEALRGAAQVVVDLKAAMAKLSSDVPKDEW
jgi:hypothetical protein